MFFRIVLEELLSLREVTNVVVLVPIYNVQVLN